MKVIEGLKDFAARVGLFDIGAGASREGGGNEIARFRSARHGDFEPGRDFAEVRGGRDPSDARRIGMIGEREVEGDGPGRQAPDGVHEGLSVGNRTLKRIRSAAQKRRE